MLPWACRSSLPHNSSQRERERARQRDSEPLLLPVARKERLQRRLRLRDSPICVSPPYDDVQQPCAMRPAQNIIIQCQNKRAASLRCHCLSSPPLCAMVAGHTTTINQSIKQSKPLRRLQLFPMCPSSKPPSSFGAADASACCCVSSHCTARLRLPACLAPPPSFAILRLSVSLWCLCPSVLHVCACPSDTTAHLPAPSLPP
ncbi:hypothetical protein BC567DRAFT_230388 [Phyllosticta citribraziliensis]